MLVCSAYMTGYAQGGGSAAVLTRSVGSGARGLVADSRDGEQQGDEKAESEAG